MAMTRLGTLSGEYHRLVAVNQYPILQVPAQPTCQDRLCDVTAKTHQILYGMAMALTGNETRYLGNNAHTIGPGNDQTIRVRHATCQESKLLEGRVV